MNSYYQILKTFLPLEVASKVCKGHSTSFFHINNIEFYQQQKTHRKSCMRVHIFLKKNKEQILSFVPIFFVLYFLTFYRSLEENFTAATCNHPIMTSRCLISTHQTHFGRSWRSSWYTSQWRAGVKTIKQNKTAMNISNHTSHNTKFN